MICRSIIMLDGRKIAVTSCSFYSFSSYLHKIFKRYVKLGKGQHQLVQHLPNYPRIRKSNVTLHANTVRHYFCPYHVLLPRVVSLNGCISNATLSRDYYFVNDIVWRSGLISTFYKSCVRARAHLHGTD